MSEQKKSNICIAADALISAVLMALGYIFFGTIGTDLSGIAIGIVSVAVPVLIVLYAVCQKKLLLTVSLGIKAIIVGVGSAVILKEVLEYHMLSLEGIVMAVLAAALILAAVLSIKGLSYERLGTKLIILLAVGTVAMGINTYYSISSAIVLKELAGTMYYVSMVLQNLADVFLWVAIILIGVLRKNEKMKNATLHDAL